MLMALDESDKIFNASACGDNCTKWILKIGQMKNCESFPFSLWLEMGRMD